MRIQIPFEVEKEQLPLDYRMGVVSFIKEALRRSDEQYLQKLYPSDSRSFKPFGFSVYLRGFNLQDDAIHTKGITVTVSSADPTFILHLYNGALKIKKHSYKNHSWKRQRIRMLNEKKIRSDTVLFRTLSPLLIEKKDGTPVSPEDQITYEQEFNYYADLVVQQLFNRPLRRKIQVEPVAMKKVVVKESNHVFQKNATQHKYLFFTPYQGLLKLTGDQEDLTCIYQASIGRRRSQGFGLLEIEREGV
ncbi:CRISPR-associated protein Cas6 [Caldalkalibacillus thermarum TA2.A1]|uniref:CRISPR-associated endoribonuclease Cas6 n=1 Tax=Caldalkalibacillus thermarum (strain TA2.A1) TaxID=986075 RepID=F5L3V8_CALTT|nr:CRISPR-associated endoribonuclease Cas6 [Caldalkalibacillus thermarum]EGL83968.1 CRISPR-associated protein Cas6 [Caldalkalibacillus thermarum TA2.A1]QZT34739.1 CRISPR-associated endoribonuclease Cas6 [Caldalkalibacillus thermarum TA2.A1]